MNRFLIFALLSVCVCAELFKRPNFIQHLNDLKHLKRQNPVEQHDRQDKRDTDYFYFPVLPCTVTVTMNKIITPKSEDDEPRSCDYTVAKSGSLIAVIGQCNDSTAETVLVRGDHMYTYYDEAHEYEEELCPVAQAKVEGGECQCEEDEDLDCYDAQDLVYEKLYNLDDNEIYFNAFSEETIDGVLYYVFSYVNWDDEKDVYYVNEDKLIMRYVHEDEDEKTVSVFNYNFDENLDKNLFKINETLFPDCCTNETFLNAPEKVDPCWYPVGPDSEEFYYEYMECNVTVEATMKIGSIFNDKVKLHYGISGGEDFVLAMESSNEKRILRFDLAEHQDDPYPIFTGSNGKCNYSGGDIFDIYFVYYSMFGGYLLASEDSDEPFYVKESVSCGKEKCTMYCTNSSKILCVTYKDSEHHDPVSFVFSTALLFEGMDKYNGATVSVDYSKVSKVSSDDVFKLDKKKYPGCEDEHPEAYEGPSISCYDEDEDENYFEPTPLPCSFVMKVQETITGEEGERKVNYTLAFNSDFTGVYYEEAEDEIKVELLRGDFSMRVSATAGEYSYCSDYNSYSRASEWFYYERGTLYSRHGDWYKSKSTVKIDNVEYTLYNFSYDNKVVYVDKDGYIAKVEYYYGEEESHTFEYKYDFDNVDMSIYKIDNETFTACMESWSPIDERFYEEPAKIPCNKLAVHDPSETMCAFRIETTIETLVEDDEVKVEDYMMYLSYKDKSKAPILTMEDKHTGRKVNYRTDLPQPRIFNSMEKHVVPEYVGNDSSCSFSYMIYEDYVEDILEELFEVFMDDFAYVTEEEVTCGIGTDTCTRYCADLSNTTCVTVLNSEPRHVLKYETEGMNITYGVPIEVKDFTEFALDQSKFPGCENYPKAYEKPKIKCSDSSKSTMVKPVVIAVILAIAAVLF